MPKMKELTDAGLFGRGLVLIADPELVRRYNLCLNDMGLTATALTKFSVDAMGWSPEIAAEQGSEYYLSRGGAANPFAIILTPEQARAPINYPFHSFDWRMMRQWYDHNRVPIHDITREAAIWLDIDEEVDLYQEPADLLMVHEVIIRPHVPGGLLDAALTQQQAIREFMKDGGHRVPGLCEKLKENFRQYGDMRSRNLVLHEVYFSDVRDFYSRIFGGVFVLRSQDGQPLLIARNKAVAKRRGVHAADVKVLKLLMELGYVESDSDWWRTRTERLEVIAESFLMDVLDKYEPDVRFLSLNGARQKELIVKHAEYLRDYHDLTKVIRGLRGELRQVRVSKAIEPYLLHPATHLSEVSREVVEQLLTYISGGRMVPLFYRHQKTAFVKAYLTQWHEPKREWARRRVREFYDIASKSSGLEL